jgi:hypothetical protein
MTISNQTVYFKYILALRLLNVILNEGNKVNGHHQKDGSQLHWRVVAHDDFVTEIQ